ncbi:MAG: DNA alkylation repair protein [Terriglobales bacterium]
MSGSRPAARRSAKTKRAAAGPAGQKPKGTLDAQVRAVIASLKRLGTQRNREGMARYAIPSDKAFGVSMATMQKLAKGLGRNHALAAALWETGWYEARMMCAFVDEPERVTPAQMDRWCRDFDNWAICDTLCFVLFDRTPHAFGKVAQWSHRQDEFEKRAAFALLASLAAHDKSTGDEAFHRCLPLVERAASDERNFVKKGVSWALRGIGRRNLKLNAAAVKVAWRLSASPQPATRWVGKDALRDITRSAVIRKLEARHRASD